MSDECRICGNKSQTRNLNVYVFGSEGVNACHQCEMAIVEFIRAMASVAGRAKLNTIKSSPECKPLK